MSSSGILLHETVLTNGLHLYIYDQSRPMAGDRWLAQLSVQIPIEIHPEYLTALDHDNMPVNDFIASSGGIVTFEHLKQRTFIDHADLSRILSELQTESLDATLPYISSPNFQARFVRKRYHDWCEQQRLQRSPA